MDPNQLLPKDGQRQPGAFDQLQTELCRRASEPQRFDPLLSFDSSMSRGQVRTQFMEMVERSRR